MKLWLKKFTELIQLVDNCEGSEYERESKRLINEIYDLLTGE